MTATIGYLTTVQFGAGAIALLPDEMAAVGISRPCVVTDPGLAGLPVFDRIRAFLPPDAVVFTDTPSNPTEAAVERCLALYRKAGCDGLVAVGGGSPIDLAKAVAVRATHDGPLADFALILGGLGRITAAVAPVIAVPTTAGTGSEVSPIAILLDEDDLLKKGVVSPHLVPDAAYVDPLLTVTMPPSVTASTGLDALTHCIEAYANRAAHPLVDTLALEGVRLIARGLLKAVRNGSDVSARTDMSRGSLYGGMCLGPVNTAAVHALAYPLGGEFHIPHGISNAVLLPHVLAFNLPAATARYADIARAMGVPGGGSDEAVARRGLDLIKELASRCGVRMRLTEYGVRRDDVERLATGAMTVTRLLRNNVRTVTHEDACRIYEEAL